MRLTHRGFTLVELIAALAIAGGAAALITATLVRQQRFYSSASRILDVRAQLRDAADVLATDIRGAAIAGFGFPLMSDSALELFTTVATSIACSAPAGAVIGMPPATLSSNNTLTSILATPDSGDIAVLYGIPSGVPDSGRWESGRVSSFSSRSVASVCPSSAGFTSAADAGSTGYSVTLTASPTAAVRKGAPIHFLRRGRYSLYRSSDGLWYLGYRRCNAIGPSVCAAIQPLSGPYRPYTSATGESGLSFRYHDEYGAQLAPGTSESVARVEIVIRGATARAAGLTGDARSVYRDSIVVTVSPRNRWR